ncbi:MAG: tRNA (adenosine(37)-N6)-threonylcarbamoyltransferase complex dimerization subunit type 1 TsaB [Desulfovibrio sp.]|nr:tRNA (adenosine(37)-N6)-threonylcarbamoyltransferase complex dimerization subunit type 1 TsaB [Desulfovibrio sp.]
MTYSTGLELILNAAEGALQIIVTDDEKILCAQQWHRPERATELLAPALAHMVKALGTDISLLRRIACVRGPGSFTGIRLVLATAAALRRTGRAQLAALDYLQALATTTTMAMRLPYGTRVLVVTHARRDSVHFRPFVSFGHQIPAQPTEPCTVPRPEDVPELARALAETCEGTHPLYVCGSALTRHPALRERLEGLAGTLPMPEVSIPSIAALCLLARHGDYFPEDVEPLYVRPSDAEENLPQLAERMGKDPEEAARDLVRLLHRPAGG